jgi:hypothetical protein
MKRLFLDDDRYSSVGLELADEAYDALVSIFDKWQQQGYSSRDISHIIQATASGIESDQVLHGVWKTK